MMREAFREWLGQRGFTAQIQSVQWSQGKRLQAAFGDLDAAYDLEALAAIRTTLTYSTVVAKLVRSKHLADKSFKGVLTGVLGNIGSEVGGAVAEKPADELVKAAVPAAERIGWFVGGLLRNGARVALDHPSRRGIVEQSARVTGHPVRGLSRPAAHRGGSVKFSG